MNQDWNEIEALSESLREHMAEIHRLRGAAQQALEALEDIFGKNKVDVGAINALRAALAEDRCADAGKTSDHIADPGKMVEPVDLIGRLEGGIEYGTYHKAALKLPDGVRFDLYTAPPKREPLTKEEINEIFIYHGRDEETFARAIERAHGIGGEE